MPLGRFGFAFLVHLVVWFLVCLCVLHVSLFVCLFLCSWVCWFLCFFACCFGCRILDLCVCFCVRWLVLSSVCFLCFFGWVICKDEIVAAILFSFVPLLRQNARTHEHTNTHTHKQISGRQVRIHFGSSHVQISPFSLVLHCCIPAGGGGKFCCATTTSQTSFTLSFFPSMAKCPAGGSPCRDDPMAIGFSEAQLSSLLISSIFQSNMQQAVAESLGPQVQGALDKLISASCIWSERLHIQNLRSLCESTIFIESKGFRIFWNQSG